MDPVSLTLAVGPILLKAAKIVKLCQDIQHKIQSAPTSLASVVTECSSVNNALLEVQNLGLKDMSFLGVEARARFGDEIEKIAIGCTNTLTAIEAHVEEFQDTEALVIGPMRQMVFKDKVKVAWKEDEIQIYLERLRGFELALGTNLKLLHMQMDMNTRQMVEMQGTVLTTLLQRSQERLPKKAVDASPRESENLSSHWSLCSASSDITDTSFDFDNEALTSPIYRQAFRQRMKNLVSMPFQPTIDRTSREAVLSLAEDSSFYEHLVQTPDDLQLRKNNRRSYVYSKPEEEEEVVSGERSVLSETLTLVDNLEFSQKEEESNGSIATLLSPLNNHKDIDLDALVPGNILTPPASPKAQQEATSKRTSLWSRLTSNRDSYINISSPSRPLTIELIPDINIVPPLHEKSPILPGKIGFPPVANPGSKKILASKPTTPRIKLVIVGESRHLKSRLLVTYTTNRPPSEYTPTVFDNYMASILINKHPHQLILFDTAGQEAYPHLRQLSYISSSVILLVANKRHLEDYNAARDKWAPEIVDSCPGVPFFLVGVMDQDGEKEKEEKPDPLSASHKYEMGRTLAQRIGAEAYLECDLKNMNGLKDVFDQAITAAIEGQKAKPPSLKDLPTLRSELEMIRARRAQEAKKENKEEGEDMKTEKVAKKRTSWRRSRILPHKHLSVINEA